MSTGTHRYSSAWQTGLMQQILSRVETLPIASGHPVKIVDERPVRIVSATGKCVNERLLAAIVRFNAVFSLPARTCHSAAWPERPPRAESIRPGWYLTTTNPLPLQPVNITMQSTRWQRPGHLCPKVGTRDRRNPTACGMMASSGLMRGLSYFY